MQFVAKWPRAQFIISPANETHVFAGKTFDNELNCAVFLCSLRAELIYVLQVALKQSNDHF